MPTPDQRKTTYHTKKRIDHRDHKQESYAPCADWVIDLELEGGKYDGKIVYRDHRKKCRA